MTSLSLIIGTFNNVRALASLTICDAGSDTAISATWAACFAARTRASVREVAKSGSFWTESAYSRGALYSATRRNMLPSRNNIEPNAAPQMRTALANMLSNTGFSSPGESLITLRTSEAAACCSSASKSCPRAWASSCLHASSCCCRLGRRWRVEPTRFARFVLVERSLLPRVRPFASLRDKVAPRQSNQRASAIRAHETQL
jgi:hypothetical protein